MPWIMQPFEDNLFLIYLPTLFFQICVKIINFNVKLDYVYLNFKDVTVMIIVQMGLMNLIAQVILKIYIRNYNISVSI